MNNPEKRILRKVLYSFGKELKNFAAQKLNKYYENIRNEEDKKNISRNLFCYCYQDAEINNLKKYLLEEKGKKYEEIKKDEDLKYKNIKKRKAEVKDRQFYTEYFFNKRKEDTLDLIFDYFFEYYIDGYLYEKEYKKRDVINNFLDYIFEKENVEKLILLSNILEPFFLDIKIEMEGDKIKWSPKTKNNYFVFKLQIFNSSQTTIKINIDLTYQIDGFYYKDCNKFFNLKNKTNKIEAGKIYSLKLYLNASDYSDFLKEKQIIKNEISVSSELKISYVYSDIKYIENNEINFKVERITNKYLTIDFGTSYIVSKWNTLGKKNGLLDLQAQLENKIGKEYYEENFKNHEENTNFLLSSAISLQNNGIIDSTEYKNDIIKISPPKESYEIHPERLLPFVKLLINYQYFPYKEIKNLQYLNKGKICKFNEDKIDTHQLILNTYNSLFRDFIIPAIKENERIEFNKIILTIPNTFSISHKNFIKKIILEIYDKNINSKNINFIVESDAVAYYYISNRYQLSSNQKFINNPEYVLVYDMGAGTLDITYLKINTKIENNIQIKEIIILDKFGKFTAGNYLDYIICKEIYNSNKDVFDFDFDDSNLRQLMKLIDFKNIVSTKIKKELHNIKTINLKDFFNDLVLDSDAEYNLKELKESELFKNYLEDNTTNIFNSIFNTEEKKLDTILITGRASQFEFLKDAVNQNLKKIFNKNIKKINIIQEKLKTIIVEGASLLPKFNSLNSNIKIISKGEYILLIKSQDEKWKSIPFFTDKEIKEKNKREQKLVFEKNIYFNGIMEIHFIYTFSKNIAKNLNENKNCDFFLLIYKIMTNDLNNIGNKSNINITCSLEENMLKIENDEYRFIIDKVDTENEVFKNSMWPYYNFD